RCEQIRSAINSAGVSEYEKEKLQERLAKLSGGVAVIRVGGASEVEVGEKKDRFVDALNATRAAVEEGILPGGGAALLKASLQLDSVKGENFDQNLGINIIREAIRMPARIIANNAGLEGAVVVGKTLEDGAADFNYGFDAAKCEYTDMIKSGIVDPLKVVRTALLDASGVSSLLTTSECMIVDAPEKAAPAGGPGGMGGMGGMM
ncbi:chaperonin, partial [Coemansia sp. 'formosensis']